MVFTELYFQIDLTFLREYVGELVLNINGEKIQLLQSLGGIITNLMKVFGLETAAEAAKALGITEDTLANYEAGRTFPDVRVIKKIEHLYGIPSANIIFFEE
jgi:transcriptional regulator with XRE-family HTH domain